MAHPLVTQLYFTRSEFVRCLKDVSAHDAQQRLPPMNCLSWIVGHLANHEHFLWVEAAQGRIVVDGLNKLVGFGSPPSTPPLTDMWDAWQRITVAADAYLETISADTVDEYLSFQGKPMREPVGKMLLRNTYHYWFHIGEAHAIRQQLGHKDLPDFVGNMSQVNYRE